MPTPQTDTTAAAHAAFSPDTTAVPRSGKPVRSVAEVIGRLPDDATPAQQDSAVQAAFHVENTHLSTRPDTLSLPGVKEWTCPGKVNAPGHYIESLVRRDTTLFPGVEWGRSGVAGDPVAYSIRGDDVLTGLLLLCFIAALMAYKGTRRFFSMQARRFFRVKGAGGDDMPETTAELRSQVFFMLQTCLLLASGVAIPARRRVFRHIRGVFRRQDACVLAGEQRVLRAQEQCGMAQVGYVRRVDGGRGAIPPCAADVVF